MGRGGKDTKTATGPCALYGTKSLYFIWHQYINTVLTGKSPKFHLRRSYTRFCAIWVSVKPREPIVPLRPVYII